MFKNIIGMDSAYKHAKSLKPYSNMGISTRLVVDMHNEILALRQRVQELEQLYLEAIKLLDAAICPCCDKSGAYYDNNGEVCQCQWCDEVNKLREQSK